MTEKFNYLSLPRITKFSLALYQKLISMGMHLILQSLVLVSKIAQFKSYAAGLERKMKVVNLQSRQKQANYFEIGRISTMLSFLAVL